MLLDRFGGLPADAVVTGDGVGVRISRPSNNSEWRVSGRPVRSSTVRSARSSRQGSTECTGAVVDSVPR
jgi:hypothetical protein